MALSVVFLQSEIDKSKYQEISLLEVWTTQLCCKYQGLKFDFNGNVSKQTKIAVFRNWQCLLLDNPYKWCQILSILPGEHIHFPN